MRVVMRVGSACERRKRCDVRRAIESALPEKACSSARIDVLGKTTCVRCLCRCLDVDVGLCVL
eukprot:1045882-Rhodomonas_salina.1